MDFISALILVAFASLILELVVFPIPSEASTYQLILKNQRIREKRNGALSAAHQRSTVQKLFRYLLPTAFGVVLFLIPLVLVFQPELIKHLLPIEFLRSPRIRWFGAGLVVSGRLFTFSSVLQLRRAGRNLEARFQPHGLFSISRNPGLVGMYAFYWGNCLVFPCAVLFVGFIPYVLNMHNRVLMEECHLKDTLGDAYSLYRKRVPRYLFF